MLMFEDGNKLNIVYTQKIYNNIFKSKGHTYNYYEFVIPSDIWNLWKLNRKKINYVIFLRGHFGDNDNVLYLLPSGAEYPEIDDLKIYSIFDKKNIFKVEKVEPLKVRRRGTYYYLRLSDKFLIAADNENSISFVVSPYVYNTFVKCYYSISINGLSLK